LHSTSSFFSVANEVKRSSEIPEGPLQSVLDPTKKAEKWIVVMTTETPSPSAPDLCNIKGWETLVVADAPSRPFWGKDAGCQFLAFENQSLFGFRTAALLASGVENDSWGKRYSRKNLGYLYAIQQGAKVIYETDDDHVLYGEDVMVLEKGTCLQRFRGPTPSQQNPFSHFGQPGIRPKGYISQEGDQKSAYDRPAPSQPYIQQGLTDSSPELGGLFYLKNPTYHNRINFAWEPPIALPKKVWSTFDSRNTVFQAEAFWGLLLPISFKAAGVQTWRSYWVQRILWEIDGNLAFLPPTARRFHSWDEEKMLQDGLEELSLNPIYRKMIGVMKKWSPSLLSSSLPEAIISLLKTLAKEGLCDQIEVEFTEAWIEDLTHLKYQFPRLKGKGSNTAPCNQPAFLPEPKGKNPSLLIAILAKDNEKEQMNALRETWGKMLPENSALFFFVDGGVPESEQGVIQMDQNEKCRKRCVVSYPRNIWIHRWAVQGPRYDYFLRLDSDTYLCVDHFFHFLRSAPRKQFFWAYFWCKNYGFRGDEFFHLYSWDFLELLAAGFKDFFPVKERYRRNTFALALTEWPQVLNLTVSAVDASLLKREPEEQDPKERCKRLVGLHHLKAPEQIRDFHKEQVSIPRDYNYPAPKWQTTSEFCMLNGNSTQ